jgi:hypothetical protein
MTAKKQTTKSTRGRPPGSLNDPATKKIRVNVSILPKHQDIAQQAGEGNVSAGLGVALDLWAKKNLK